MRTVGIFAPRFAKDGLDAQYGFVVNLGERGFVPVSKPVEDGEDYHAFSGLVLDQTLRGILKGYGPEELREFIKLPPKLASSPWLFESYGLLQWYAPYIMNYALGWWDGDASTLAQVTPTERAKRLVPLMGGRDRVLEQAAMAEKEGDLVWALELLNYLWRDNGASDPKLRLIKARVMRSMAQSTTSSIQRAFLLSQARAYEGGPVVPKVVAPQAEQVAANPVDFVNRHRVRIDPLKAAETDALLRFEFPNFTAVALHIRRGVADFVADANKYSRKADVTLRMTGETWRKLYVNEAQINDLIAAGEVTLDGDAANVEALLDLFDRLNPVKNTILRPPQSIHAP